MKAEVEQFVQQTLTETLEDMYTLGDSIKKILAMKAPTGYRKEQPLYIFTGQNGAKEATKTTQAPYQITSDQATTLNAYLEALQALAKIQLASK